MTAAPEIASMKFSIIFRFSVVASNCNLYTCTYVFTFFIALYFYECLSILYC
nr:MAG TPA: hypothetical protein [Caudoviricetes sp.]